jgi:acetyltransferase-like isoleucine patch superfamily enzyme
MNPLLRIILRVIINLYYIIYSEFGYLAAQARYVPGIKFPKDSLVYWRCRYVSPGGIHIGHHTIISNDAFLDGRQGIFIGNNVNIGAEVRIYTMRHDLAGPTFTETTGGPVYINDWVYIANRVTIFDNVTIGEGAVVATGAVVTKDIAPWTVVGGVPARFINERPVVKYTLDTRTPARLY